MCTRKPKAPKTPDPDAVVVMRGDNMGAGVSAQRRRNSRVRMDLNNVAGNRRYQGLLIP